MGTQARGLLILGVVAAIAVGAVLFRQRTAVLTRTADPRVGERVFFQNCAVCHGAGAEGKDFAPPLNRTGHADHHPDWELYAFIAEGKVGFTQMPAWKERLSDREIRSVIAYIKTLWTEDQRKSQQHVNEVRPAPPVR
ncbi:MAG: c-type cytochrome [Candidatus Methylomirabilaceae bacterium]